MAFRLLVQTFLPAFNFLFFSSEEGPNTITAVLFRFAFLIDQASWYVEKQISLSYEKVH